MRQDRWNLEGGRRCCARGTRKAPSWGGALRLVSYQHCLQPSRRRSGACISQMSVPSRLPRTWKSVATG
eukprot:1681248-Prymnesium_polylepis.3